MRSFGHQNVSKMIPKWSPKFVKTASKHDAEIATKKYKKTYPKLFQNGTQNGARGGPKSSPGAPDGAPRAPGPPWDRRWTPRDLILEAPELPRTPFWYHFGLRLAEFLMNFGSSSSSNNSSNATTTPTTTTTMTTITIITTITTIT